MKNISSNKNLITIAVICVCCVVIFAAVIILISRGKSDADDAEDLSEPIIHTQVDENGNLIVAEGSDYLPESCVGSWAIAKKAHIIQSPRNTDMSEKEAVKQEYNSEGVLLAYDCYKTSRVGSVFSPFYKVQDKCSPDLMDAVGMQSDGILDEFGKDAAITRIEVYDQSGANLYDTVFVINDTHLIYYGTGNFVFDATKVEAVG